MGLCTSATHVIGTASWPRGGVWCLSRLALVSTVIVLSLVIGVASIDALRVDGCVLSRGQNAGICEVGVSKWGVGHCLPPVCCHTVPDT